MIKIVLEKILLGKTPTYIFPVQKYIFKYENICIPVQKKCSSTKIHVYLAKFQHRNTGFEWASE